MSTAFEKYTEAVHRINAERAIIDAAKAVADYLPGDASFNKRYGDLRRAVERFRQVTS